LSILLLAACRPGSILLMDTTVTGVQMVGRRAGLSAF
jgi:hypothetical protein